MKQKDFALIIAVAGISAIFAIALSSLFIVSPKNRNETAETVEPMVADFPAPSEKYFNDQSIDPTQVISIEDSNNQSPFNAN